MDKRLRAFVRLRVADSFPRASSTRVSTATLLARARARVERAQTTFQRASTPRCAARAREPRRARAKHRVVCTFSNGAFPRAIDDVFDAHASREAPRAHAPATYALSVSLRRDAAASAADAVMTRDGAARCEANFRVRVHFKRYRRECSFGSARDTNSRLTPKASTSRASLASMSTSAVDVLTGDARFGGF